MLSAPVLHSLLIIVHVEGSHVSIPMVQVDAHNIVPCWVASNKLEYSARTIRSKIQSLLPTYLPHLPPPLLDNPRTSPSLLDVYAPVDWDAGDHATLINIHNTFTSLQILLTFLLFWLRLLYQHWHR